MIIMRIVKRTYFPILHIILGIAKKLFGIMIKELQSVEDIFPKRMNMKHVIDMLSCYVSNQEEWKKKIRARSKIIKKDYEKTKNDYSDTMLQNVSNDCGLLVREKHNFFCK